MLTFLLIFLVHVTTDKTQFKTKTLNKHVAGKELTLKNGCPLTASASSLPPPKRFRGSLIRSLEMKSDTTGDKSSEMMGSVFSIRLQKRNPFLHMSLPMYILKSIQSLFIRASNFHAGMKIHIGNLTLCIVVHI